MANANSIQATNGILINGGGNGKGMSAPSAKVTSANTAYNNVLNKRSSVVQNVANQTKPKTYVPSGGGGGGGYATASNPYADLLDYFKQQNENARQSAIDAIRQALNANVEMYNNQLGAVDGQYDSLINQSEASRYRSGIQLREAQANRGQLDSGLGRSERLNLDTKYANQLSNIKLQKQSAKDNINNAISQLRAQAQSDEAQVNNSYAQALSNYLAKLQ